MGCFKTVCLPSSKLCRLICRCFSFSLLVIAFSNDSRFIGIPDMADSAPSRTVLTTRLLPTCFAMPEPSISWTVGVLVFIMLRSSWGVFGLLFFEKLFGGMCLVFTMMVPFGFSMGSVRVVSRISKPMMASALPVSIRGDWTLLLILVYATIEPPRWAMPWISAFVTSNPSSRAASQKMSLRTTMPWPPTPVNMRSSFVIYCFLLMALCGQIISHTPHPLHSVESIVAVVVLLLLVWVIAGQPKCVVHKPQLPHLSVISLGGLCSVKRRGQGRWAMITHGSL